MSILHILLYLFASIGVLLAIAFIVAIFVKKEYIIRRSVTINKPTAEVFDYIKLLDNQVYYNKWVMADPDITRTSKGTDGTVGFYSAWTSQHRQVGQGEQVITKITEGERIELRIRFIKPFAGIADVYMATEPVTEEQTKIRWGLRGTNKYPMTLMNLVVDRILGGDMEISLSNLKRILEA
jgi:uncharacterized protein YndB with AHSA1/START domain